MKGTKFRPTVIAFVVPFCVAQHVLSSTAPSAKYERLYAANSNSSVTLSICIVFTTSAGKKISSCLPQICWQTYVAGPFWPEGAQEEGGLLSTICHCPGGHCHSHDDHLLGPLQLDLGVPYVLEPQEVLQETGQVFSHITEHHA